MTAKLATIIDCVGMDARMITRAAIGTKGAEAAFDDKASELKRAFLAQLGPEDELLLGGGNFRLVLMRDEDDRASVPAIVAPGRAAARESAKR